MPRNRYHDTPVVEFHEAFGHPVVWSPKYAPNVRAKLRVMLLVEEVLEFVAASGFKLVIEYSNPASEDPICKLIDSKHPPDIVQVADALGDIRYVTDGASLEWGIPLEKILREVHRSNMSKLGEDGKPVYRDDGKVMKGPNFTPPEIEAILELYKGVNNE